MGGTIGKPDEWYYCIHAGDDWASTASLFEEDEAAKQQVPNIPDVGHADDDDFKEGKLP